MRHKKRRVFFIFIPFLFLILFIYFFIFKPVKEIKAKANILKTKASETKFAFSQNNIDLLKEKLNDFEREYDLFQKSAQKIYWLSFIPYVSDFKNAVMAGDDLINAGKIAVDAILPYADLIGFKKGEVSFVEKSAQDRLQTAVLTLDKILEELDPISNHIAQAENKINKIDLNRYPENIGKIRVRERIEILRSQFLGVADLFVSAKPLIKNLPNIFGKDEEKTYLILFQNDKELRATGGFLTAYAIFKVKDGKIKIERSEDIYQLDNSISSHPKAPKEILTYHKGVNKFYIRDSNLSPDFPTSVKLFESLYQKSNRKLAYNGIIAIDTNVLVDLLTIFGDTEVNGIVFSAKLDKRCDCPQVIYKLFDIIDRPTPYIRENRKGILGDLMYTLFYKALGFSPSKYWGVLAQEMLKNLNQKHILLYFVDEEIQKAVEKVNFAGKIKDYSGDYLHINNVNFAGAKANMFVSEKIYSYTIFENNLVKRELEIEYKNPYPHSDCNLERGGLCLNATLRNWLRVYVPKGSELISFKGSLKKVNVYEELGKTVFEGYLEVPTQGKAMVKINYTLPGNINKSNYTLMLQKQPGKKNQKLVIEINKETYFQDYFNEDKEIKIK